MGSAGSGRFGTYRIENGQITGGTGIDDIGGGIGEFECPSNIENIRLEDVATSNYYDTHKSLPANGVPVDLNNIIYKGRYSHGCRNREVCTFEEVDAGMEER